MPLRIDVTLDYFLAEPADVLLQIEAAPMADQRLIDDRLTVTSAEPLRPVAGEEAIGQRTWVRAAGVLRADYTATIEIDRAQPPLAGLPAMDHAALPGLVVPYLMPSRYIESDRFETFVSSHFGALQGGDKVLAMQAWLADHLVYLAGTSDSSTTAAMTFVERRGVCRDYAHLLAGFARAAGIPARLVSAYAPEVTPPDFHAVVEVWLGDAWQLVDATGMACPEDIVRICVGRDATDIAFMTVFGFAEMRSQRVSVTRI